MKRLHHYVSYLLRLWRFGEDDATGWRASLENPMTGERQGFASLGDLFAFLEAQTDDMVRQAGEIDEGGEFDLEA